MLLPVFDVPVAWFSRFMVFGFTAQANEGFRASVSEEMLRMASNEELRQGDFGCDIELVRDRIFFRWCWSALVVDDQ